MSKKLYLGLDIGSISTKGVVIDAQNNIVASEYIWTSGDPIGAVKKLLPIYTEKLLFAISLFLLVICH